MYLAVCVSMRAELGHPLGLEARGYPVVQEFRVQGVLDLLYLVLGSEPFKSSCASRRASCHISLATS